jgi:DNA-binding winged helix-turn-helix (wHTH) protein/tetratricopeptide (TPR) repeat protein
MVEIADEPEIAIGAATLRPATCEFAYGHGVEIVELQVVRVLLVLAKSQGRVVSRDTLVEQGWNGRSVSEDAINRVTSRIRRLATATGAFELDTIRGVGYRLRGAAQTSPGSDAIASPPDEVEPPRRVVWPWLLAGLSTVAFVVIGAWLLAISPRRTQAHTAPSPPTIAVMSLSSAGGDHALADRLTTELRSTISRMHGLNLIDPPVGGGWTKTDLVLDGSIDSQPRPVITLALHDGRSAARIWGATFDGRTLIDPSAEERAVAAPAQYLAIWLGDRLSGQPAASGQQDPEVAALVSQGRRALRESGDARLKRRWPESLRWAKAARVIADRALAIDPSASGALMLRFELDSWPLFPRKGETMEAFKARREEGERSLAQALASDPDNPDVLVAASHAATQSMRWDDAGKLLLRAVAIDPNSAAANAWYAYHLARLGQCGEGLKYAKVAAGLEPDQGWTQMVVPRLLNCAGRQNEALADYRALMVKEPASVFLVREVYLWLLARRDAKGIRELVAFSRDHLWRGHPPEALAGELNRASAGADALDGKPQALLHRLDVDRIAITNHAGGQSIFGRTEGDSLFPLALEYAEAGATNTAIILLRQAVEAGSLYLPWALPYGSNEFPPSVRADPRYGALWRSSPRLAELMQWRSGVRH